MPLFLCKILLLLYFSGIIQKAGLNYAGKGNDVNAGKIWS